MRNALLAIAIAFAATSSLAAPPQAGDAAPPITIEHTLQTPEGVTLDWAAFGDDPVLLEFWGTWCGPCVAAIPHLNEMAHEMQDENLRVLAVTFEEPDDIKDFLKIRQMEAWVLCDTDRSMVNAFGVTGWPESVLIKNGKVLHRAHPATLDTDRLRKYFDGAAPPVAAETISSRGISAGVDPFSDGDAPAPTFNLTIRAGASGGGSMATSDSSVTMISMSQLNIVAWAWGIDPRYVVLDESMSDQMYDLIATIPSDRMNDYRPAIQSIVAATLSIDITLQDRPVTGYELNIGEAGVKFPAAPSDQGGMSYSTDSDGSAQLTSVSMTVHTLAQTLPDIFGAPVRDRMVNEERYFVELNFEGREPEQIIRALAEQAGIIAAPFETTTTYAIVKPKD